MLIISSQLSAQSAEPQPAADGYRGIWYMNTPVNNEYRFKYSGGLATYCAKHRPFAVYAPKVHKTFFCYGGTTKDSYQRLGNGQKSFDRDSVPGMLLHMVSYYDHKTGKVPKPTILLDKMTSDAHDNPVISIDDEGYIWIFSTSHGLSRPSYIHRSKKPYDISEFDKIEPTYLDGDQKKPLDNFSYFQIWHNSNAGFVAYFTKYQYPVARTLCFMTSPDGTNWSPIQRIAAFGEGHYQITASQRSKSGSAFNYHPSDQPDGHNGLNWRTNLYYVETDDYGKSWHNVEGKSVALPLKDIHNPALVKDYEAEGLLVYLKDIRYDAQGHPIIVFITSKTYEPGPENLPTWRIARWTGDHWEIHAITQSDNNYDMGSLYLLRPKKWMLIAPAIPGPQPFNPGGEVGMWLSRDQGTSWKQKKVMTQQSPYNHTYIRRPTQFNKHFCAFWADGNGRQPSVSRLYFSDVRGHVFMLPPQMHAAMEKPVRIKKGAIPAE